MMTKQRAVDIANAVEFSGDFRQGLITMQTAARALARHLEAAEQDNARLRLRLETKTGQGRVKWRVKCAKCIACVTLTRKANGYYAISGLDGWTTREGRWLCPACV